MSGEPPSGVGNDGDFQVSKRNGIIGLAVAILLSSGGGYVASGYNGDESMKRIERIESRMGQRLERIENDIARQGDNLAEASAMLHHLRGQLQLIREDIRRQHNGGR